ncbi:hypothetical protein VOLCADRAFT_119750 [Volvox carteri f. nagariensis]|uniref:MutL C-terminal dimerisation domain-containing protein n=1 Tax=Volvox carteri f. nagariensis TaxID=3068 RepID=D8UG87_VOLCA|nr:uncharacterized protein VOLCADRAFT_119750 [Volvox carteri f. nagariensis]EFJ41217.1 hypothetical protein VOLCADRAFT_119750 [Volvox carteri f. nagariensis]|eukprot:XP_002957668.1 hypothetical protein VOLCADRAFT_119750 [Volvox carteri f. nagariensis]
MLLSQQPKEQQQLVIDGNDSVQVLVSVPSICGTTLTNPTDLRLYLHQLDETGGAGLLPPAVLRVLRSKACRTAIMFGDHLTPEQCTMLVAQLRDTRLWTQCAHGRPTVVPLVDLPTLHAVLARRRGAVQFGGMTRNPGGRNGSTRRRLNAEALRVAIQRDGRNNESSRRWQRDDAADASSAMEQ